MVFFAVYRNILLEFLSKTGRDKESLVICENAGAAFLFISACLCLYDSRDVYGCNYVTVYSVTSNTLRGALKRKIKPFRAV